MAADKRRLDILLVERGLAPSRERAQALILAGKVLVNDEPQTACGQKVLSDVVIRLRGQDHPYVSRGALKLEAAIREFSVEVKDKTAMDVGASTGGFTQVLLLAGAKKVFAVDVGTNQLDWSLRSEPRVVSLEGHNVRDMEFSVIGEKVDLIVMDLSFISVEKVIPNLMKFCHSGTEWITLIKPQFEVGKGKVGKGGIVRSESDRLDVVSRIRRFVEANGMDWAGLIDSPITGTQGNIEFLSHWKLKK